MRMERAKNAGRNAFFGIILKIYQILIPFLMRTAMIYLMGVEYLGLNSLFSSILQVLNLAELGVGSAMVFSMYKPIAEEDATKICALERLYLIYYRVIGLIIAVVGIILTPFVPKLINGNVPANINVYVLYLLNLAATVLTYWLFAYKNSLFQAHQRNDIPSKITILTNTIQYLVQFLVLLLFHNYYYYVIVMLATNTMNNIIVAIMANKVYPNYKPKGKLPKEEIQDINQRIKDLFTAKLGATIVNSADTIVISAFLGLTALAMYQNYYFILSAVMGIVQIIIYSCLAGIGNSMVTESLEKNYNDFKNITFIINWITTICVACFGCMYQPFIELWVGKKYLFDYSVVILFCIYFYLIIMQQVFGLYKDAAGIWHQDRFRPLVAALVNLTLNLLLVKVWGIYAIILSTVISYLIISIPWMMNNVFKYAFKRSCKEYLLIIGKYCISCSVIAFIVVEICSKIPCNSSLLTCVVNCLIAVFVSNICMWVLFRNNTSYNYMIDYINRFTRFKFEKVFKKLKTRKGEVA